jgi:hypothetical protein
MLPENDEGRMSDSNDYLDYTVHEGPTDFNIESGDFTIDFFCYKQKQQTYPPIPNDGQWHHVTIIRTRESYNVYVDARHLYDIQKTRPRKAANQLKKWLRQFTGVKR